jgi:hypothetical protein
MLMRRREFTGPRSRRHSIRFGQEGRRSCGSSSSSASMRTRTCVSPGVQSPEAYRMSPISVMASTRSAPLGAGPVLHYIRWYIVCSCKSFHRRDPACRAGSPTDGNICMNEGELAARLRLFPARALDWGFRHSQMRQAGHRHRCSRQGWGAPLRKEAHSLPLKFAERLHLGGKGKSL